MCDVKDPIQRQIYFAGLWEPVETYLFLRLLQPGMTVIDVGANVGQFTLLAATAVGREGAVHSFEPVPATFARLKEHVRSNRLTNVVLNEAALWREDSTVTLGLSKRNESNSASGGWSVATTDNVETNVRAQGIRLDAYVEQQNLRRVDVIKFDIEGAEPFAIAGARNVLRLHHPTMLIEVNRPRLADMASSPGELWAELQALGYRAWKICQSLRRSGPVSDLDAGVDNVVNFILHHGDLPAGVTSGWARRDLKRWACSGW